MTMPRSFQEGMTRFDDVRLVYESWDAYVDRAANGEFAPGVQRPDYENGEAGDCDSHRNLGDYARQLGMSATFEEAVDRAINGWPEGLAEINKRRMRLIDAFPPSMTWKKETQFKQVGPGRVHMGRFIQDHPKPWMARVNVERLEAGRQGKVVVINDNVSASAGTLTDAVFERGAAIACLVDLLEQSGRRVEIILHYYTTGTGNSRLGTGSLDCKVYAKRAQDPLDMERLCFALCSDAPQTRFGWAIKEQFGIPWAHPVSYPEPGAILMPAPSLFEDRGFTNEGAVTWIKQIMAEQGVTISDD